MNKVFVPSLKMAKQTRALSGSVLGFSCLISIFTCFIFTVLPYTLAMYMMKMNSGLLYDNIGNIYIIFIILCSLITIVDICRFALPFLHAYRFEGNRIICGTVMDVPEVSASKLIRDADATRIMVSNLDNSNLVQAAATAQRMGDIISRIMFNCDPILAGPFFDTTIYKKKIYNHTMLIKETNSRLIYSYEAKNGKLKKLSIPKMYEGMPMYKGKSTEMSFALLIFIQCVMLVLGMFILYGILFAASL